MKKGLFWTFGVLFIVAVVYGIWYAVAYNSDTTEKTEGVVPEFVTVVADSTSAVLVTDVEKTITLDKEAFLLAVEELKKDSLHSQYNTWETYFFETDIELVGEVDTLTTPGIVRLVNVFGVCMHDSTTKKADTRIYRYVHAANGEDFADYKDHAFWVEDGDMLNDTLSVTFKDAFERLVEADCVKPKSRFVTLRKQLGTVPCNAQWVFGNDNCGIVWVDAETKDVSLKNPACKN